MKGPTVNRKQLEEIMKRDKGEFGYIKSQKIKRGLITLVMFAIPIIIFLTGLFITKTRLNMFTLSLIHI